MQTIKETTGPDWKPGFIRVPRPQEQSMRVPDFAAKCIGFVAAMVEADATSEGYDLEGTGFFVGIPSKAAAPRSFFYFVTAKHVISSVPNGHIGLRVNLKGGGAVIRKPLLDQWFFQGQPTR